MATIQKDRMSLEEFKSSFGRRGKIKVAPKKKELPMEIADQPQIKSRSNVTVMHRWILQPDGSHSHVEE